MTNRSKCEQTFKSIFGAAWRTIPPVFQKRYINRAFSNDISIIEGTMDIHYSKLMSWVIPAFRLLRILAPYKGNNVPVKVSIRSQIDSDAICLDRKFYFTKKRPYEFNARLQMIGSNDVIELMRFGLSWRNHYFYDGKKVVMQHKGYLWRVLGFNIPLPLEIILGRGHAEEIAIDDDTYNLTITMTHALLGPIYRCSGEMKIKSLPTDSSARYHTTT